jgi:spermidine synthase
VNTAGAVLGAAFGGLVMLPTLGVHGSLKAGIVTNLVLAVVMIGAARRSALRWRWGVVAAAGLAAAGVALAPAWDVRVLSSGPAIYANAYHEQAGNRSFDDILRQQKVVFYRDGATSSVSVGRDGQTTYLRINGKTDASTDVDMATQIALGHLPLLFHADPRRVLVIGLGAGITPGAVAAHPVEQVDVVEIEPAVVEAARFFADVQGNVMRDRRLRLVIGDARRFVRTTPARYDVIISEPSNPWVAGVSDLFTVEFFRLARERLAPGGVMLQWIHAYNLFPEDFRMVVKTFQTVFPSTTMWEPDVGDFLLLGRTEAGPLDLDRLRTRFAANATVRRDLQRFGIEAWPGVFALLSLGEAETARFAQSAALNTDDRLRLEFAAPRALYADTRGNLALIRSFRDDGPPFLAGVAGLDQPEAQYGIGMTYLNRGAFADAIARFQRALERDPSYTPAMRAIALARTTAAERASRQAGPAHQ